MRLLIALLALAPLAVVGTLAVEADQPARPVQLAAESGDNAADRESYADKADADLKDWEHKVHEAGQDVAAKSKEAGDAAKADLDAAWVKTEEAGHKLKTAGAEGWSAAKSSYEQASHDLAKAWNKYRSKDSK